MKANQILDEGLRDKYRPRENRTEVIASKRAEERPEDGRARARVRDETSRETKLSQARDLSDMNKWKKPKGSPRETSRVQSCLCAARKAMEFREETICT